MPDRTGAPPPAPRPASAPSIPCRKRGIEPERAIQLFGAERLLRTPDCGFATFADNRLNSDRIAQAKLAALAQAAQILRQRRYSA